MARWIVRGAFGIFVVASLWWFSDTVAAPAPPELGSSVVLKPEPAAKPAPAPDKKPKPAPAPPEPAPPVVQPPPATPGDPDDDGFGDDSEAWGDDWDDD